MTSLTCRIIVDPEPLSGAVNMATDAALLQAADERPDAAVVRIYRWCEPTVSVGYFQKPDQSLSDPELQNCPQVRRLTGGGAILHHHEVTYSCVIPRTHPFRDEPLQVYDVMHRAISAVLESCGASIGFRADLPLPAAPQDSHTEPFLCFLRSDPRDLAAHGSSAPQHPKITGSAQRRRRGTILQHGSILLRSSPLLPQTPGICDLFPAFDLHRFNRMLPGQLAASIADRQNKSEYTEYEQELTFRSLSHSAVSEDTPMRAAIAAAG